MTKSGLLISFVVLLCSLGAHSADPLTCATQLYKDLVWYDAVVKNITNQHAMGNEAKLSTMCRALYLVIIRAVQLGCPLSRVSELQTRQRNLMAAGATTCLAARPQTPANQVGTIIPHTVAIFTPSASVPQPEKPPMANRNMYDVLDPCDMRIRNCYLQFQIHLLMRFGVRRHTCDIIDSFANCLLSLRHCGFAQSQKPLIVKQAISSTQFAFWETKECPTVNASIIRDTTTARLPAKPSSGSDDNPYSKQTSPDCGKASFKCLNGNCVNLNSVCNTVNNCGDNSDEIGCQSEDRRNALEIEKIFVKYHCYDVMSTCTSLHIRPLLLLLQVGQLSSIDTLCKASNKVFHCAVHESCPLSAEDRARLSAFLIKSFEQLVSRRTCQLIDVNTTFSSPNISNVASTLSTRSTITNIPDVINSNTLFTDLETSISANFTSTGDVTEFANSTSTPDITFASSANTADITGLTNSTSTPDITFTNSASTAVITDFIKSTTFAVITNLINSTSTSDITDSTNPTSTTDITDFTNTTRTPNITNSGSTTDITDFTNTTSTPNNTSSGNTPDITSFTNTTSTPNITHPTSTPDITDLTNTISTSNSTYFTNITNTPEITNTTSIPDFTNFTQTASNPYFNDYTSTTNTVISTNSPNFSTPSVTYSSVIPTTESLDNSSIVTSPCVKSCDGLPSGNYQSCAGCNLFATCSEGVLYDKRSCPAALLWDDAAKRCDLSSSTCQAPHPCVSSCNGLQSGDYQSCQGCTVYLTCNNGTMQDNRPCQAGLVWNDINKRCEQFSPTCVSSGRKTETPKCVKSCDGLASGNYQSCLGCNVYASCDNDIFTDNRPCPNFMLWDDTVKRCENVSDTCA